MDERINLNVRLNGSDKHNLDRLIERTERSKSDVVRLLLKRAVQEIDTFSNGIGTTQKGDTVHERQAA